MTIEKQYRKKTVYYAILDDKGVVICRFPTLAVCAIVHRFLNGGTLTDSEITFAIECLNNYDAHRQSAQ